MKRYRNIVPRIVLYCHDVDRGVQVDGRAFSPVIDGIRESLEHLGAECISVAHPYSKLTGRRAANSVVSVNLLYFLFSILNKLFSKTFLKIDFLRLFYIIILRKIKCNLVIGISPPVSLCLACKYCKILIVDVAHGYSHTAIPQNYLSRTSENLPDVFVVFSPASYNIFKNLSSLGSKVLLSEHPGRKMSNFKVQRFDGELVHLINRSLSQQYGRRILISFNWGYAGDYPPFNGILQNGLIYNRILDIIPEYDDIFWFLRLHPVQLRGDKVIYRRQQHFLDSLTSKYSNCEWRVSSRAPIGLLAQQSDFHISMASGACYDVADFGIQSLMLCPTLRAGGYQASYFNDLVEQGFVFKEECKSDRVCDLILNARKKTPRDPPDGALDTIELGKRLLMLIPKREIDNAS